MSTKNPGPNGPEGTHLTWLHHAFAPIRRHLPRWATDALRRSGTALVTPALFTFRSGHWLSSMKAAAVTPKGEALPWYSYPCIELLTSRSFGGRKVLEFGAGQSSLWWASRADSVVSFEGDPGWYHRVRSQLPDNAEVHLVSMVDAATCVGDVQRVLADKGDERYDVIVIDGLHRGELVAVARERLAPGGAVICDNAEGYGFYESFAGHGFSRVDFIGHSPGVVLPQTTAVFFKDRCFLFANDTPIPDVRKTRTMGA